MTPGCTAANAGPVMGRPGVSLLEAVLALAAGAVVVGSVAGLVRADERLAFARAKRLARDETVRIAAVVLHREVAALDRATDVRAVGRDSAALRLFRGFAVTCAPPVGAAVAVRFTGAREPDPAKDSILPLALPTAAPLPLWSSTRGATCSAAGPPPQPGEEDLAWELPADPGLALPGTPLLLFQSGTYALSDAALRVRHGGEGRQPLTGEWLDSRNSSFTLSADTASFAHLLLDLSFKGVPVRRRLRVPFNNAASTAEAATLP